MLQVIALGATLADVAITSAVGAEAAPAVKGGLVLARHLVSTHARSLFRDVRRAPTRQAA